MDFSKPIIVFIGLGSNLDVPTQHINSAFLDLDKIANTKLIKKSSLYQTKPVGEVTQDDFINAVACLQTTLNPLELLEQLQAVENQHQRVRKQKWGPRTLDLDLLLYGDEKINLPNLTVPHPEMFNRGFVLMPLYEIAPDLMGKLKNPTQSVDLLR